MVQQVRGRAVHDEDRQLGVPGGVALDVSEGPTALAANLHGVERACLYRGEERAGQGFSCGREDDADLASPSDQLLAASEPGRAIDQ